jgi:hypothetical protein
MVEDVTVTREQHDTAYCSLFLLTPRVNQCLTCAVAAALLNLLDVLQKGWLHMGLSHT